MTWVRRDLKDYPAPTPSHGQGTLSTRSLATWHNCWINCIMGTLKKKKIGISLSTEWEKEKGVQERLSARLFWTITFIFWTMIFTLWDQDIASTNNTNVWNCQKGNLAGVEAIVSVTAWEHRREILAKNDSCTEHLTGWLKSHELATIKIYWAKSLLGKSRCVSPKISI